MTEWTLYVTDQIGNRQAQIDTYHSFKVIARHNAVATWELELPMLTNEAAEALLTIEHPRIVLRADNLSFRSGPMTAYERVRDVNDDVLTVNGVDDTVWLTRRLAHPTPLAAAPPYTSAYDDRSGPTSQVIAAYVDVNAGPSATPARRVPGLVVPAMGAFGGTVVVQARYEKLSDFIMSIANTKGLGVRIVDLALDVFAPVEVGAVFSTELGTLAETVTSFEAPSVNYVYVAGGGEAQARTIHEVVDGQSTLDWGRIEAFQDRRDTSDDAALDFAGQETLTAGIKPREVSFTPLDTDGQQFPHDWTVGDLVSVRVGDSTLVDVVREVTVELSGGDPVKVSARIGAASDLALFRSAIEADRRIRQLERI